MYHMQTMLSRSTKWRILTVSIMVMMVDSGFLYAIGSMFVPMLDTFGGNRSRTAAVQSIYNGITSLSATMTAIVITKWGPRFGILLSSVLLPAGFFVSFFAKSFIYLYVSVGIIGGIGNSFAFVSSVVAVGHVFREREKSMALSLQLTAMGLSSTVYPYFLDVLLDTYGLAGTFLILSGVFLHTSIAVIVYRYEITYHNVERTGTNMHSFETEKQKDDTAIRTVSEEVQTTDKLDYNNKAPITGPVLGLCSVQFVFFAAASCLLIGNISGFISIAQDIFVAKGLSLSQSLTGFLIFNICSTVSRLGPGLVAKLDMSCFITPLLCSLLGLAGQLTILFNSSLLLLLIGSGLSGAALGGYASAVVTVPFCILKSSRQAVGLGIVVTINGIFITSLGPVFGAMRDMTGVYEPVLVTTSSLNVLCFLCLCIVVLTTYLHKRRP